MLGAEGVVGEEVGAAAVEAKNFVVGEAAVGADF
jgi:hypothetical protein